MRFEFDVNNFALTNVQIKPHCCIPSETITSTFKGFLARATKISSEKYLSEEIEYLTDIFCENRHGRKNIKKDNSCEKRTRGTNNNNNNNNNDNNNNNENNTTKSKDLPFLGYQKSDQKSKRKYNSLD